MIIEGEDGVTHINIYSKARTSLGRWLSNFTDSRFTLDGIEYGSIEGLWFSYTTGQEHIRMLHGFKAKQEGAKFEKIREIDEDLVRRAIDEKLRNNPDKMRELAESDLKLCHYYEYAGKRVDAHYEWLVEHFETRRKQLKEHYGK